MIRREYTRNNEDYSNSKSYGNYSFSELSKEEVQAQDQIDEAQIQDLANKAFSKKRSDRLSRSNSSHLTVYKQTKAPVPRPVSALFPKTSVEKSVAPKDIRMFKLQKECNEFCCNFEKCAGERSAFKGNKQILVARKKELKLLEKKEQTEENQNNIKNLKIYIKELKEKTKSEPFLAYNQSTEQFELAYTKKHALITNEQDLLEHFVNRLSYYFDMGLTLYQTDGKNSEIINTGAELDLSSFATLIDLFYLTKEGKKVINSNSTSKSLDKLTTIYKDTSEVFMLNIKDKFQPLTLAIKNFNSNPHLISLKTWLTDKQKAAIAAYQETQDQDYDSFFASIGAPDLKELNPSNKVEVFNMIVKNPDDLLVYQDERGKYFPLNEGFSHASQKMTEEYQQFYEIYKGATLYDCVRNDERLGFDSPNAVHRARQKTSSIVPAKERLGDSIKELAKRSLFFLKLEGKISKLDAESIYGDLKSQIAAQKWNEAYQILAKINNYTK